MFCDEVQIKVIAGKGGDGCSSFRREKYVAKGGPNGGDGGKGGNVIIKVNTNLNTLSDYRSKKTHRADKGGPGLGKNMHGKNGEHLVINVPQGTIIFNEDKSEMLADLSNEGEQIVIARGGIGGMGNARFATSTHQAPRFAEIGEPGEESKITMELKLVADVGIIGLPSAGKSTLISVISNAKPKIAAYHFTTLVPNLGVAGDFVVADIPGLIEGASKGKGLGHQFLKHVSRTRLLAHVIDVSLEKPDKQYKTIRKELEKYDEKLAKLPEIIVLNKVDLLSEDEIKKKLKELKKATPKKLFTISAVTHEGLQPLLAEIRAKLKTIKKVVPKVEKKTVILRPHLDKVKFSLDKIDKMKDYKIFHVSGKRIEQLVIMTDTSNLEGLERIYQYIDRYGIQKAVEREGARLGDKVEIKGKIIPYRS